MGVESGDEKGEAEEVRAELSGEERRSGRKEKGGGGSFAQMGCCAGRKGRGGQARLARSEEVGARPPPPDEATASQHLLARAISESQGGAPHARNRMSTAPKGLRMSSRMRRALRHAHACNRPAFPLPDRASRKAHQSDAPGIAAPSPSVSHPPPPDTPAHLPPPQPGPARPRHARVSVGGGEQEP